MTITAFYAGLIGLLYVSLAINVIRTRSATSITLGHGDDKLLERRIRAHANCAEYAPLALLLIAFAEVSGLPALYLHVLGASLVVGRSMHGFSLSSMTLRPVCRVGGMAITFTVIGVTALVCVYLGFQEF